MAGTGPQDLQALADDLLAACEFALNTIPDFLPGLEGAPQRSYVSPGEPAADCCPQLTVNVAPLSEAATTPLGLGAGRRAAYTRINHVGLIVTIFRCVPVPSQSGLEYEPPEAEDLEAAAEQINADGWALWNHLLNRIRQGLLFGLCREVFFEGGRELTPQGGCGGWVFAFRVALDGYEEDLI